MLKKAIPLNRQRYLKPALDNARVEITILDKPNSSVQHYKLTEGRQQQAELGN